MLDRLQLSPSLRSLSLSFSFEQHIQLRAMHLTSILFAATLLSQAISVPFGLGNRGGTQLGSLTLQSNCSTDTYFWVVNQTPGAMQTLNPGQSWSQQFQVPQVGGISVKISQETATTAFLQMEYTAVPGLSQVFYDMSVIDGNGGFGEKWLLTPSQSPDPAGSSCAVINSSNDYQHPGEGDKQTHACSIGNSFTLALC